MDVKVGADAVGPLPSPETAPTRSKAQHIFRSSQYAGDRALALRGLPTPGADEQTNFHLPALSRFIQIAHLCYLGIFDNMVVKGDDPTRLRIVCGGNLNPLTCSTEMIPRALVNEKCVSAFEFNRIMPRPSSRSGGSTIGKTAAHSSFKLLDSRGLPTSANFSISVRCGFTASERLPARHRPVRSIKGTCLLAGACAVGASSVIRGPQWDEIYR
jgi:hypothetical protein